MLLPVVWEAGCSRPVGLSSPDNAATPDQHQIPFHEADGNEADGNAANPPAAVGTERGPKAGTDLPFAFGNPQSLPAGTLLTVRLKNSVAAEDPNSSGTFEAIVDEPVTVEGSTLVPRGASVAGRIESARTPSARLSEAKHNGYVRLTLNSLDLVGKDQALQTSSLFARGSPSTRNGPQGLITLEKGRRLTFRLTEPVYLAVKQSPTDH